MTITLRERRPDVVVARPERPARQWDAVIVAALAVVLSATGAARPSLWFDEAATISAGTRSVPELWRMLGHIDAVHGLYYLLMHAWFLIVPATEFMCRLSSALAVGVAAAGVVTLGRQLSSRSVAVTAGVVFAVLPRVTWAGMETRSYALTMAAAVWLTVFCVRAARRDRKVLWCDYFALLAGATLLNVFLVLMVPVHAVTVWACGRQPRALRDWAVATFAAVAAVTPFLMFTQTQLFQVRWISPLQGGTAVKIVQDQYFDRAVPFAVVAGTVLLAGGVDLWRRGAPSGVSPGRLALIAVAWMTVPTATLLLYSALRHPVYYPRYLSFTAPAMALLLGLCVVAVGRARVGITAILTAMSVAAVPNYLAQRGPYAKEQMDYSQVADVIERYAAPGDCLVLDNSTTWKPGPIRPLLAARPAAYEKLHDYGRGRTAVQRNMLWDSHIAIWAWADKMPDCPALWTITERDPSLPDHESGQSLPPGPRLGRAMAYQVPSRFGFRVVERWQFSFAQVTKSVVPAV
ncbi:MAG: glycosyltransferase family 39 protein [Mycobacterium sp.]